MSEVSESAVVRKPRSKLLHFEPLLVGRLSVVQASPEEKPRLEVSVWCPHCKINHLHRWVDPPFRRSEVLHVKPRCEAGPWLLSGYWIGLDVTLAYYVDKALGDFRRWGDRDTAEASDQ